MLGKALLGMKAPSEEVVRVRLEAAVSAANRKRCPQKPFRDSWRRLGAFGYPGTQETTERISES